MHSLISLSFAVLTFAASAAPASAQTAAPATAHSQDEQFARCANESRQYSPNDQIAGCTALIQANPQNEAAYYNRGNIYGRDLHQYDRAIADFDQAIRLNPQDAEAYHNRGMAYEGLGQKDHALADFDQAAKLDPDHYEN